MARFASLCTHLTNSRVAKIRMGKRYLLLTFFILLCHVVSSGQYQVTASVIDEENKPEEYATYRVFEIPGRKNN